MAITNAIMQMRRGLEADFDADKMRPGEWAVSTDTRYVRMCFSPGVCVRMATYDAFEADMAKIRSILEEVQTIEEAVRRINTEVSANAQAVEEYTEQAKQYRDEAKQFRDEAEQFAPDGYIELKETVASNTVKIDTIIEKAELNIKNSASGENIHLTDSANGKNVAFGLYGKAEQDGEPTPDNQKEITVSGSDGSVEVVSCGKNLLKNIAESKTVNNITFTINEDKSVTVNTNGATANTYFAINGDLHLESGKYILSDNDFSTIDGACVYVNAYNNKTGVNKIDIARLPNKNSFEYDESLYTSWYVGIYVPKDKVCNLTFYPMISFEGGEYQPYKETLSTIPTPTGLAGIKVDNGGNYTDQNGQQWIADEIVKYADGSGKKIQRIGKRVLNGTESFFLVSGKGVASSALFPDCVKASSQYVPCMSNLRINKIGKYTWEVGCFGIDNRTFWFEDANHVLFPTSNDFKTLLTENPMEVYYPLEEPIITDLTAEEIAEIEKLHTFYPITNISNDADCGIAVTYIADSKLYIDNQLAIQKAQQEEALATMLLLMPEEVQASMIENDTNNLLNESEV